MGLDYEPTNKGHRDYPNIFQEVGEDPPREVLERARRIQEAQQAGLIPTMADPRSPTPISIQPFEAFRQDVNRYYRAGMGGEVYQPGQGYIPPTPVLPQVEGENSGNKMPPSPEQPPNLLRDMLRYNLEAKKYENSEAVLARKNKYALELMNAIGDKQMEYGWKSNLIGFALNKLPDMFAAPARARNQFLYENVANLPQNMRAASGMFTGGSTGNYAMGI